MFITEALLYFGLKPRPMIENSYFVHAIVDPDIITQKSKEAHCSFLFTFSITCSHVL